MSKEKVVLCDEQLKFLLKEIHISRDNNTDEHSMILASSRESAELAEKIDDVLTKWNTFWGIIKGLRNAFFTVGFLFILARMLVDWGDVIKQVGP